MVQQVTSGQDGMLGNATFSQPELRSEHFGALGFQVLGTYRGYIGIMEKRMETTIIYRVL